MQAQQEGQAKTGDKESHQETPCAAGTGAAAHTPSSAATGEAAKVAGQLQQQQQQQQQLVHAQTQQAQQAAPQGYPGWTPAHYAHLPPTRASMSSGAVVPPEQLPIAPTVDMATASYKVWALLWHSLPD